MSSNQFQQVALESNADTSVSNLESGGNAAPVVINPLIDIAVQAGGTFGFTPATTFMDPTAIRSG